MAKKSAPKKPTKKTELVSWPVREKAPKVEPIYNAAGWSRKGIAEIVTAAEYNRMGRPGYPWSDELKAAMVEACNGLKSKQEIAETLEEMMPHA